MRSTANRRKEAEVKTENNRGKNDAELKRQLYKKKGEKTGREDRIKIFHLK